MIIITRDIEEKNKRKNIIEDEKNTITLMIKSHEIKKNMLQEILQRFTNYLENISQKERDENIVLFVNNLKNSIAIADTDIYLLNNLIDKIEFLLEFVKTDDIIDNIEKYNIEFNKTNEIVLQNLIQIDETINSIILYSFESKNKLDKIIQNVINKNLLQDVNVVSENNRENDEKEFDFVNNKLVEELDLEKYPENTLIVSEKDGIVLLPYKFYELNRIYSENKDKYTNFEEIIKEKYVVKFYEYRNPSIARFREAFKLIRVREKLSIFKAFELGMELFFDYNLHPAIISACRNLEELEVYLSCLNENRTHDFNCFKIRFDMAPIEVKDNKFKLFGNKNKETVEEILAVELESKTLDIEDIKEEIKEGEKALKQTESFDIELNSSKLNIQELEKTTDSEVEITKIRIPNKTILRRNEDYNIIEYLKNEANEEVDIEDTKFEDVNKAQENVEDLINESTLDTPDINKIVIPDEVKELKDKTTKKKTNTKSKSESVGKTSKKVATKNKTKKEE